MTTPTLNTVFLKPIDKTNYQDALKLQVEDSQKNFVASNVYSLAQAYIFSDIARPYGIYVKKPDVCEESLEDTQNAENTFEMVGFAMLDIAPEEDEFGVWRFMIDQRHQGKGYGREAMKLLIQVLKEAGAKEIELSYEPENAVANSLYVSLGFKPTGEVDEGEIVMSLDLSGY
jgi:diamine N-acetyltransferase